MLKVVCNYVCMYVTVCMLKVYVTTYTTMYFIKIEPCLCAFFIVQVANTKKETVFKWYKDGSGIDVDEMPDLQKGECHLSIPRVQYHLLIRNDSDVLEICQADH